MADWTFASQPAERPVGAFLCKDIMHDWHMLVECSSYDGLERTAAQLDELRARDGLSFERLTPMVAEYLHEYERMTYGGAVDGYALPFASTYKLWH